MNECKQEEIQGDGTRKDMRKGAEEDWTRSNLKKDTLGICDRDGKVKNFKYGSFLEGVPAYIFKKLKIQFFVYLLLFIYLSITTLPLIEKVLIVSLLRWKRSFLHSFLGFWLDIDVVLNHMCPIRFVQVGSCKSLFFCTECKESFCLSL